MDTLREFYEAGYGRSHCDQAQFFKEVEALGQESRIWRAVRLLKGCSGTILDVGCGGGHLLYLLRTQFSRLIGVDVADAQLAQAKVWSGGVSNSIELRRCNVDCEEFQIVPGTVDACSCIVLLECVLFPERVLSKISNVLREDGTLVVSVGNIVSWKNRIRALIGREPRTTVFQGVTNGGALHTFSQASLCGLVEKCGFLVDYIGCSGRLWKVRQFWPSLLGGDIFIRARKRSKR